MAGRDDFTEEQWDLLHRGLTGAGMWVALSERGFTSTFKESTAMASFLAHQASEAGSQLARELCGTKGTGWKVSSSPEELRQQTLAALKDAVTMLGENDSEDLTNYRALVLALANHVAAAASGGEDVEAHAIEEISAALGG
jgi:hypothetical protein